MQKGCGKFVVQYHTSVWMCRVPISNQMQLFDKTRTTLESDRRFIEFKSSSLFCIPANAFTVLSFKCTYLTHSIGNGMWIVHAVAGSDIVILANIPTSCNSAASIVANIINSYCWQMKEQKDASLYSISIHVHRMQCSHTHIKPRWIPRTVLAFRRKLKCRNENLEYCNFKETYLAPEEKDSQLV